MTSRFSAGSPGNSPRAAGELLRLHEVAVAVVEASEVQVRLGGTEHEDADIVSSLCPASTGPSALRMFLGRYGLPPPAEG